MSFPAYPEYTNTALPWLGEVPSHWEIGPFKRLVEIQNGADYKHVCPSSEHLAQLAA